MPKPSIKEIIPALRDRTDPAVTILNRIEGRPRTRTFERSLRAEVRDALWMLTRQWQTGEFEGDDAGSPFFTKTHLEIGTLSKYQPGDQPVEDFPNDIPLEAIVERQTTTWTRGTTPIALDMRLIMGRHWLKLLHEHSQYIPAFLKQFPIEMPALSDSEVHAHPEVRQALDAVAGRAMDGGKLYLYLKSDASHRVYDDVEVSELDKASLDELGSKFVTWADALVQQPVAESQAWDAPRLEYRFRCAYEMQKREQVLCASEYAQGTLDWYNLNLDDSAQQLGDLPPRSSVSQTLTTIASPIQFAGMPHSRWWKFEDGQTNFGDISASTTDIAKLLFIEFGLLYANDWFVVPCTLPAGSITKVRGMVVTNVFGERTWIEASGRSAEEPPHLWSMFSISHNQLRDADNNATVPEPSLLLLPTLPQSLESAPVEEILMFRDETANYVWAIEKTVTMPDGVSKSGAEAAFEVETWREANVTHAPEPPLPPGVKTRYRLRTSVPGHWIPFIPVHVAGDNREVQLQRAAMATEQGDINQPTTSLLRAGLGESQMFIHEEEVPRSGIRLVKTYQRARWTNGKVILWQGWRKQVGRGEGSSGLAFDQIES